MSLMDDIEEVSATQEIIVRICKEMYKAQKEIGRPYASPHELVGVLKEEYDEFWDSVKADEPDTEELVQLAAVALRGILEIEHGICRVPETKAKKAAERRDRSS